MNRYAAIFCCLFNRFVRRDFPVIRLNLLDQTKTSKRSQAMIKFRYSSPIFLIASFLYLLLPQTSAQSVQPNQTGQEVLPIRNFLQVNEQFCTGGQPRLEHLAKLKADGVKAVINLRQPG